MTFDIALAVGLAFVGDRSVPLSHAAKDHSHVKDTISISAMEFAEMPLALFEEDLCMPGWGMLYILARPWDNIANRLIVLCSLSYKILDHLAEVAKRP